MSMKKVINKFTLIGTITSCITKKSNKENYTKLIISTINHNNVEIKFTSFIFGENPILEKLKDIDDKQLLIIKGHVSNNSVVDSSTGEQTINTFFRIHSIEKYDGEIAKPVININGIIVDEGYILTNSNNEDYCKFSVNNKQANNNLSVLSYSKEIIEYLNSFNNLTNREIQINNAYINPNGNITLENKEQFNILS